jgi:hypothetical protein
MSELQSSQDITATTISNTVDINIMPFQLTYDGPAPIQQYMKYEKQSNGTIKSHFRGREIIGKTITLPDHLNGLVVSKSKVTGPVETTAAFQNITIWEHDLEPDISTVKNLLDWFDVAKSVSFNSIENIEILIFDYCR